MTLGDLEQKVQSKEKFLSEVTGSPIRIRSLSIDEADANASPLQYRLVLGSFPGQYAINYGSHPTAGSHIGGDFEEIEVKWSIGYNSALIFSRGFTGSGAIMIGANNIQEASVQLLLKELGGVSSELPFMDFESYTIDSLKNNGSDSYFGNIYLVIMTHMKELRLKMPPILSKKYDVEKAVEKRDVALVTRLLAGYMNSVHDPRLLAHMKAEAAEIVEAVSILRNSRGMFVR